LIGDQLNEIGKEAVRKNGAIAEDAGSEYRSKYCDMWLDFRFGIECPSIDG
jgi:hypothetical protein